MLSIPNIGCIRDDVSLACDWIEVSCWLEDDFMTSQDVLSELDSENIFEIEEGPTGLLDEERQQYIDDLWLELVRRSQNYNSAYPFSIEDYRIEHRRDSTSLHAYLFFPILSVARYREKWTDSTKHLGYNEQGSIFEIISKVALDSIFPRWETWISGWGADNPGNWNSIVEEVCERTGATKTDEAEIWDTPNAKERGMDILLYRHFGDARPSLPCFLIQCGSGKHWPDKLAEPELNIWESALNFHAKPNRAFCCPYYLEEAEFKRTTTRLKPGFFIDRERLLCGLGESFELDSNSQNRIEAWVSQLSQFL